MAAPRRSEISAASGPVGYILVVVASVVTGVAFARPALHPLFGFALFFWTMGVFCLAGDLVRRSGDS